MSESHGKEIPSKDEPTPSSNRVGFSEPRDADTSTQHDSPCGSCGRVDAIEFRRAYGSANGWTTQGNTEHRWFVIRSLGLHQDPDLPRPGGQSRTFWDWSQPEPVDVVETDSYSVRRDSDRGVYQGADMDVRYQGYEEDDEPG